MADSVRAATRLKRHYSRTPRVCDECKLRKKKCNGSQPCLQCSNFKRKCTFEMSTRISQSPTERIRNLEQNLRSIRNLLQRLKRNASTQDLAEIDRVLDRLTPATSSSTSTANCETRLESILVDRHCLLRHLQSEKFYGPRSGPAVIVALLEYFEGTDARDIHGHLLHLFSEITFVKRDLSKLPETASPILAQSEMYTACRLLLSFSHPLLQFLDLKGLQAAVQGAYQAPANANDNNGYQSLCHMVVALCQLLDLDAHRRNGCEESVNLAFFHYQEARDSANLPHCQSFVQLQAILCMVVFSIFTSSIDTAHAYLAIVTTGARQHGLLPAQQSDTPYASRFGDVANFSAVLSTLDNYFAIILDQPSSWPINEMSLSNEDLSYSHKQPVSGANAEQVEMVTPSDAFISQYEELTKLTVTAVRALKPDIDTKHDTAATLSISENVLNAMERNWSAWQEKTVALLFSRPSSKHGDIQQQAIMRHQLQILLRWSQFQTYLPLLHYLQPLTTGRYLTDSLSRPALSCLKLAVQTINTSERMFADTQRLQNLASFNFDWLTTYTILLSVLTLIFLISLHEGTSRPSEAWRQAEAGIRMLAELRCKATGARYCLDIVKNVVRQLNHTVDFDIDEIERSSICICQRYRRTLSEGNTNDSIASTAAAIHESDSPFVPKDLIFGIPALRGNATQIDKLLAKAWGIPEIDADSG